MTQLQTIIDNYRKLCDYCDTVWARVRETYPNEIACRKGCGICCELQSVNRLEAHIIRSYMENINDNIFIDGNNNCACPFLNNSDQSCRIYPARPIICRTHGLILQSSEFSQAQSASCPYNFPSIHPSDFPAELALDTGRVTKNLTNLNLAFCMVSGIDVRDEGMDRVPLKNMVPA